MSISQRLFTLETGGWENSSSRGRDHALSELAIDLAGQMAQGSSDGHRVWRGNLQLLQMLRQASQLRRRPLAYLGKRRGGHQPLARPETAFQQRLAGLRITFNGQDISDHTAIRPNATVDLLTTWPSGLALGAFAPWPPGILLQFVDTIQERRIWRSRQSRADGEIVDGGASRRQGVDRLLVEVATGQDAHVCEASLIENAPDPARVVGQITTVDTHPLHDDALVLPAGGHGDDLYSCSLRVIGVEQQKDVIRLNVGKVVEGLNLVVMGFDERVCHSAIYWDAKRLARCHRGRPGNPGQIGGTGGQQTGLGAMRTPKPKVNHPLALSCQHHASRF